MGKLRMMTTNLRTNKGKFETNSGDCMVDVNKPVTNPALVAAIEAVRAEFNGETEATFLTELKQARFLSPVTITPKPEAGADGEITLPQDTTISFFTLNGASGAFLPAFTDWDELRKWRNIPDEQTLITTYEDLRTMVLRKPDHGGFAINPYGCDLLITPEMLQDFERPASNQYTVQKDTQVLIGKPADYPHELVAAVSKRLKTQKNVKSAYLVLMKKEGESSFLIVVDFIGDRRTIFDGIAAVALPHLKKGELIDFIPLESGIGADVARDYPPFYKHKRKAFGLF
jgi:hypothetical protein